MEIRRGIEAGVAHVVKNLQKLSQPTKDPKEIAQVGTISANGDAEIGGKLAEALRGAFNALPEAKNCETALNANPPQLDKAAEIAVANPYPNPRPLTREDIRNLLEDAFTGRRPEL